MSPSNALTCPAPAPSPSVLESAGPAVLVGLLGVGLGILLGRTVLAPKQPAATLAPTATQTRVNAAARIEAGPWAKIAGDSPTVQKYVEPGNGATAAPYGRSGVGDKDTNAGVPDPTDAQFRIQGIGVGNATRRYRVGIVIGPEEAAQVMQRCWDQFVGLSPMEQGSVATYLLDRYAFAQGNPYMGNLRAVRDASRGGSSDWLDVQISALQESVFAQNSLGRQQFCEALYAVATAVGAPIPTAVPPAKYPVPTPSPTRSWK